MAGKHRKALEPWPVLEAARRYDLVPRTSPGRHVAEVERPAAVGEHVGLDLPKLAPARPARPRYR